MIPSFNLIEKFEKFTELWTPKIIGELNDQYIKIAKVQGEFIWHDHEHEDELFYVCRGTLYIDFEEETSEIKIGHFLVVPKGKMHRPRTNGEEVWIMLIEPKTTKHTGDVDSQFTVKNWEWI